MDELLEGARSDPAFQSRLRVTSAPMGDGSAGRVFFGKVEGGWNSLEPDNSTLW